VKAGAFSGSFPGSVPDLAGLVETWTALPSNIKAAILALAFGAASRPKA
jgi:hypothetical protein